MKTAETIIVGGGPAGAACAGMLRQAGRDVLVLDKKKFPRNKICAGWITPQVWKAIDVRPEDYPFLVRRFDRLNFHLFGIRIPVRTRQYAIRRYEFDNWLLERAAVDVEQHTVKRIVKENDAFVIDQHYRCRYLVGAGGTHCPVYKTIFRQGHQKPDSALITAVEKEYRCGSRSDQCHLWYFENRLPGYAWFVPKGDKWINIGIGAKQLKLEKRGRTIMDHWQAFVAKLRNQSMIERAPGHPRGHTYYLNHDSPPARIGNAFAAGDAVGLSTLDMGEGICAAVKSGMHAAGCITGQTGANDISPSKLSLPGILFGR